MMGLQVTVGVPTFSSMHQTTSSVFTFIHSTPHPFCHFINTRVFFFYTVPVIKKLKYSTTGTERVRSRFARGSLEVRLKFARGAERMRK